mmetsp:Transcript_25186/g.81260  ORF Transcript_25186/g.81260 Transcript_25186/m.81260 type:complete len:223 (+) Transcript_25186:720-1388(+)
MPRSSLASSCASEASFRSTTRIFLSTSSRSEPRGRTTITSPNAPSPSTSVTVYAPSHSAHLQCLRRLTESTCTHPRRAMVANTVSAATLLAVSGSVMAVVTDGGLIESGSPVPSADGAAGATAGALSGGPLSRHTTARGGRRRPRLVADSGSVAAAVERNVRDPPPAFSISALSSLSSKFRAAPPGESASKSAHGAFGARSLSWSIWAFVDAMTTWIVIAAS